MCVCVCVCACVSAIQSCRISCQGRDQSEAAGGPTRSTFRNVTSILLRVFHSNRLMACSKTSHRNDSRIKISESCCQRHMSIHRSTCPRSCLKMEIKVCVMATARMEQCLRHGNRQHGAMSASWPPSAGSKHSSLVCRSTVQNIYCDCHPNTFAAVRFELSNF